MKPAPFRYVRTATVEATLELLREHGEEAKILAGGQSLMPLLNMRFARPGVLVDVNRVPGLDHMAIVNKVVRVGALVRQAAFAASPVVQEHVPLAARCMPLVGHPATRNRGTVGGSIAHADARAELPLALTVLGGKITVRASDGAFRNVAAEDFFVTHFTSALDPTDLVVETLWPAAAPGSGFAFEELALRSGDYAIAMAACAVTVDDGRATSVRIGVGAAVDRPRLLADLSAGVTGRTIDAGLAREVGNAASFLVDPAETVHATAAYQRRLTAVLVERALLAAWRDASEPR